MGIKMDVRLINSGEPAASPAVTISWNSTLQLNSIPKKCIFLAHDDNATFFKCKLGRLLQKSEGMTVLVSLDFFVPDGFFNADFVFSMVTSTSGNGKPTSRTINVPLRTLEYMGELRRGDTGSHHRKSLILPEEINENPAFPVVKIYIGIGAVIGAAVVIGLIFLFICRVKLIFILVTK